MSDVTGDRIEKRVALNAPISRVWRAITDHKEFGTWFQVNLESPFVVGEKTRGQITHPECRGLVMELIVDVMEPQRTFAFRRQPTAIDPKKDYSNDPYTVVEFKLEAVGDRTVLHLTESGFDALPAAQRDECFRRNEGGWIEQVKNIENYVTKNP